MEDDFDDESKRFQTASKKHADDEDFEEDEYEQDFDHALENTEDHGLENDSLKFSSSSINFSVSKTGGFDEHIDLPPARYNNTIEEYPEENEESKYQQPTAEELNLQNERIKKAKEALIKIKKTENSQKKNKKSLFSAEKPKAEPLSNSKKEIKTKQKSSNLKEKNKINEPKLSKSTNKEEVKKIEDNKQESFQMFEIEQPVTANNSAPPKENSAVVIPPLKLPQNQGKPVKSKQTAVVNKKPMKEEVFSGFQIEKPVNATNSAPVFQPESVHNNNLQITKPESVKKPALAIKISENPSIASASKKKEDEAKLIEDHKKNFELLKPIIADKKEKADKNLKNMEEIQKKLLEKEKNLKVPAKEPAKAKKVLIPPPAPQPRSLNSECYKLHQLAEGTGNKDSRLSADKISGSMLQAIKILSVKLSEEFPYQEILDELKRAEQGEKALASGKEMKRNEVDTHEEAKKKIQSYKDLITENINLMKKKDEALKSQDELTDKIKKLEPLKAVVKLGNGKYVRAGMLPDNLIDTLEELESVGSEIMKENPVDVVIEKIEKQGYTLQKLFNDIDSDGDKILTITEIRNGLAGIQIRLDENDKNLLLKTLDANSDGVVSEEEFYKILDSKLKAQQDYHQIIGNLDVNNPIVFEERILDMKLRGKMLHHEIPKFVNQLKSKIEAEKKILNRIKQLENILEDRQIKNAPLPSGQLEEQIKTIENKKNQIFTVALQEKSTNAMNLTSLQEKIVISNKERAALNAEAEHKKNLLANSKMKQEILQKKEKKLNEENRLIAIVMIQSNVRKSLARIRYKKAKERTEKALMLIVRVLRRYVKKQKEKKKVFSFEIREEKKTESVLIQENFK